MKNTLYLLLLFAFHFGSINNIQGQNLIKWTQDKKLKWSDFKATPDTNIFAYALTSYRIQIQPENVLVDENNEIKNYEALTVSTYFDSNLSWVYKKEAYLLKHEQLHFDIAALYTKKINEEFEKLKADKIANYDAYVQVYQRLWKECRALQAQYDKETKHGILKESNDKWIDDITNQLESSLK